MKLAIPVKDGKPFEPFDTADAIRLVDAGPEGIIFSLDFDLPDAALPVRAGFISGMRAEAILLRDLSQEDVVSLNNAGIAIYPGEFEDVDQAVMAVVNGQLNPMDCGETACYSCEGCPGAASCQSFHE